MCWVLEWVAFAELLMQQVEAKQWQDRMSSGHQEKES